VVKRDFEKNRWSLVGKMKTDRQASQNDEVWDAEYNGNERRNKQD
jgi:hypothetical protein